jgi:hypothetical protein
MTSFQKRYEYMKQNRSLEIPPDIPFNWYSAEYVFSILFHRKVSSKTIRDSSIYRNNTIRMRIGNASVYNAEEIIILIQEKNVLEASLNHSESVIPKNPNPPCFTAHVARKALGFSTRQAFYKSMEYLDYLHKPENYFRVTNPEIKSSSDTVVYYEKAVKALQKAYIRYYAYSCIHASHGIQINPKKSGYYSIPYKYSNYLSDELDTTCPDCHEWAVDPAKIYADTTPYIICPSCGRNEKPEPNKGIEFALQSLKWFP